MKIEKRTHWLVTAVVGMVILYMADKLIFPWWQKTGREITVFKASIAHSEQVLSQKDRWLDRQRIMTNSLFAGGQSDVENQVLKVMTATAASCGVNLVTLRPTWQENAKSPADLLRVTITFNGTPDTVYGWIYALETSQRPFRIGSVTLRSRDDDGKCVDGDMTVEIPKLKLQREEVSR